MIFETMLDRVDVLSTHWADLRDSMTELRNALPPAFQPLINQLGQPGGPGFIFRAETERLAVTGARGGVALAVTAPNLIALATPIFTGSRIVFTPIQTALGVPLPALQATPGLVGATAAVVQANLNDLQTAINTAIQEIEEIVSQQGPPANLASIRGSLGDLSTYPVLTQDFGYGGGGVSSNGGAAGGTPQLGHMVDRALSSILGVRPRLSDTKSFVSALNTSFVAKEVEGHTVVTWNKRGGLAVSELGGSITGAQASLYERAKAASDSSLPLLEALTPLRVDFDNQEVEAVRSIVRTAITELVNEFGVEGGPRVERVDDLIELLIDPVAPPVFTGVRGGFITIDNGLNITNPANANLLAELGRGELGRLGDVFGLTRQRVNTIEEERNLTNFLIIQDHINGVLASWQNFRGGFLGGVNNFLGTQLVLIQRTLAVVAESVSEVYFAMDSVFLGQAERQTARIDFPNNVAPPMFVDELFSWVRSYASDEAPNIIQEGGKAGIRAIVPTLRRLHDLVNASIGRIRHPGATHTRVRRTIAELAGHLDEAARLCATIV